MALAVNAVLARTRFQIETGCSLILRAALPHASIRRLASCMTPTAKALEFQTVYVRVVKVIGAEIDKCAGPVHRTASAKACLLRMRDFGGAAELVIISTKVYVMAARKRSIVWSVCRRSVLITRPELILRIGGAR